MESAPDRWPLNSSLPNSLELPELKRGSTVLVSPVSEAPHDQFLVVLDLQRFSSLNKLLKTVAYIRRWCNSDCKNLRGPPSQAEQDAALMCLIQRVQRTSFTSTYERLSSGGVLQSTSALIPLQPTLRNGLLYSVGRTQRVENDIGLILLPSKHRLTDLIILHHHDLELHSWVEYTLASTRSKY